MNGWIIGFFKTRYRYFEIFYFKNTKQVSVLLNFTYSKHGKPWYRNHLSAYYPINTSFSVYIILSDLQLFQILTMELPLDSYYRSRVFFYESTHIFSSLGYVFFFFLQILYPIAYKVTIEEDSLLFWSDINRIHGIPMSTDIF